ncbi:ferritin-like domain-containing protein [Streptomyces albus subsp. chlorinus]|uniref:ferritin-like domain-containing protein n=1 Tax=Streptomyces albus TaxID=1888 RepID=UPI00156FFE7C|nr:ferritin-like domain-containing protein [Streptomyces albus]NSC25209.1 ferritin-like domain-containing protein [Streptomyces albus subsp. chlorinus]
MNQEEVTAEVTSRFDWDYTTTLPRVADLYERGKAGQWDPRTDIDWDVDVRYGGPLPDLGPDTAFPYPDPASLGVSPREWQDFRWEHHLWTVSQFLHGEQGALLAAARLVEMAPDMDSKYFAATQVVDEARHVEVFSRYLGEKVGDKRSIDPSLATVLKDILTENTWDLVFLGMQIIAEGYALASFRLNKALFPDPLIAQITSRVARDEARHMTFGLLALDGIADKLSARELRVREEFICDTLSLLCRRVGIDGRWQDLGLGPAGTVLDAGSRQRSASFKRALFSRVLPNLARLKLLTPYVHEHCGKLGLTTA